MVIGRNKQNGKGTKGGKRKPDNLKTDKNWYEVKAPTIFTNSRIGKTLVTHKRGGKSVADSIKDRVFEVCLADLQQDEDKSSRKVRLAVDDVSGGSCVTSFRGMYLTTSKLRSVFKKRQTTIEAHEKLSTSDKYELRVFVIGFTKKRSKLTKRNPYAQTSQVRLIRKRMKQIVKKYDGTCDLNEFVRQLIPEVIGQQIEKSCSGIFPLHNCMVRKVKVLNPPAKSFPSKAGGGIECVNASSI